MEELTKEQQELADSAKQDDEMFLPNRRWEEIEIKENTEWLDLSQEFTAPKFTLSINGVKLAPIGGVHGITGQPGHGKTMTFTQIIVALLRGSYGNIRYEAQDVIPNPRVLYIDTEMEVENTLSVNARINHLMGWPYQSTHYDRFRILWLREVENTDDRYRKVLKAIYDYQPDIVLLDGLIDIIGDFNDNKENQQIIYEIMKVASHYKLSMWCLLHQNPGSNKMVGHSGSFLERKVTDLIVTKKEELDDKSIVFTMHHGKARAKDLPDLRFEVDDSNFALGVPIQITPGAVVVQSSGNALRDQIKAVLPNPLSMTTRDLQSAICKVHQMGSTNAHNMIVEAEKQGIIRNISEKKNAKRFVYQEKTQEDTALPFPVGGNEPMPF